MPKGYRRIVIATLGWLSLAAGHPPGSLNQTKQDHAARSQAKGAAPTMLPSPVAVEIERPKKPEPCGPGQYYSNDDLCAQWKAADAASDAAWWTMASFVIGVIGTIGLLINLYLTREAVRIAKDATEDADTAIAFAKQNADAAQRSADIAESAMHSSRQMSEIQNRAMIAVDWPRWIIAPGQSDRMLVEVTYQNYGAAVALNVRGENNISVRSGITKHDICALPEVQPMEGASQGSVPREMRAAFKTFCADQPLLLEAISRGEAIIVVRGWIVYDDVFQTNRETRYCFHIDAQTVATGESFNKSPSGNSIT